jgi:hypothetical protein
MKKLERLLEKYRPNRALSIFLEDVKFENFINLITVYRKNDGKTINHLCMRNRECVTDENIDNLTLSEIEEILKAKS